MYFVFTESFSIKDWNGEIARFESGISGTHNASMYLAEALASKNHIVDFVSINNNLIETTYKGVNYINYENYNITSCDYIITTFVMKDLLLLNKINSFKKIIVLMNNDICNHELSFQINKDYIIIAYLNQFCKTNIEIVQPFLKDYNNIILPNSIDLTDIQPFDIETKEKSLCFFACPERGLKMATEVLNRIDNFILYANTYGNESRYLTESSNKVVQTNGYSKYNIFEYLAKSRYFVYPLINLDNSYVHYDTFGYVVLEALLHGVIVIVPKINVYEELFGDAICYVDTEGIISEHDLSFWTRINSNFGLPLLDRYLEKIEFLESSVDLRRNYIEKGLEVGKKYCNHVIARKLLDILS